MMQYMYFVTTGQFCTASQIMEISHERYDIKRDPAHAQNNWKVKIVAIVWYTYRYVRSRWLAQTGRHSRKNWTKKVVNHTFVRKRHAGQTENFCGYVLLSVEVSFSVF